MRVFAPNAFQFRNVRYPQGWQEVDSITAQLLKNAGWVTIFDPPFNSPIILAQSGVPILLTGNTSQNTLAAVIVPGGLMGKNGRLRVFAFYAANNNANTKTANVKFGGGGLYLMLACLHGRVTGLLLIFLMQILSKARLEHQLTL